MRLLPASLAALIQLVSIAAQPIRRRVNHVTSIPEQDRYTTRSGESLDEDVAFWKRFGVDGRNLLSMAGAVTEAVPTTKECELQSYITCERLISVESPSPAAMDCSDLHVPNVTTCEAAKPTQLRWIYTGRPCSASNTKDTGFVCAGDGITGASTPPPNVFVDIHGDDHEQTYFSGKVSIGGLFVIKSGTWPESSFSDILHMDISQFDPNVGEGKGRLLQTMEVDITCAGSSDLVLLQQYGALELTGFENSEEGAQHAFESLKFTYGLQNTGSTSVGVDKFDIETFFFGDSALVSSSSVVAVEAGDSLDFMFETFLLNMFEIGAQPARNDIVVSGMTSSAERCEAVSSLTISLDSSPNNIADGL